MPATPAQRLEALLAGVDHCAHEAEVTRNPFSVKAWLAYLEAKNDSAHGERRLIFERALRLVPRSYKLWYAYLGELEVAVRDRWTTSGRAKTLVGAYERALLSCNKFPRIWLDYLACLRKMGLGSEVRRAFDRCLMALPITQHHHVWPEFVGWASEFGVVEAAVIAHRRWVMYEPNGREAFVDYLVAQGKHGDAIVELVKICEDDDFASPSGKSRHQLWMRLCDLCAAHPEAAPRSLDVDALIRSGLARFTDEVGKLWCKLADYYIRLGDFEDARDVYEEAVTTVVTVRDFSLAFDAYAQFEESVIAAKMKLLEDGGGDSEDEDAPPDIGTFRVTDELDLELRLARLERLMTRRPLLLSSVVLRQNPHNVKEWHARAALVADDPPEAIACYGDAVKTVDPARATGKVESLWIAFARYYEDRGDLANARVVFDKACAADFRGADDLAAVYCAWAEMELRGGHHDAALDVARRACVEPPALARRRRGGGGGAAAAADRVHRNPKVWALYLDLEESLGTLEEARAAYDRCLELKVATPAIVLNYARMLDDAGYHEASFGAYERGVALFRWPHVRELWSAYLGAFVARFGGAKLERARDLYEQALRKAPPADAAKLYVDYAKLEETHGLARRAAAVYERAAQAAPDEAQFDAYALYAAKVERAFGAAKARPVYEAAVAALRRDGDVTRMCLKFAALERALGEVDRARGVLAHGAQFADPNLDDHYWATWRDFEVHHGNEDTFRDMLRVKRSVETARSGAVYAADNLLKTDMPVMTDAEARAKLDGGAAGDDAGRGVKRGADEGGAAETEMEALERQAARIVDAAAAAPQAKAADPNEIDLDDDDDDDEGEGPLVGLAVKPIPAAVFGSAADQRGDEADVGALARFRAKA